jgi:hypothetical protein
LDGFQEKAEESRRIKDIFIVARRENTIEKKNTVADRRKIK